MELIRATFLFIAKVKRAEMKLVGILSVLFALISVMDAFDQHLRVKVKYYNTRAPGSSYYQCCALIE